jgi:hypothetical protein
VGRAFLYPLRIWGILAILVGGFVWSLVDFVPMLSLAGGWLFLAFYYAYLYTVVESSASGINRAPPFPGAEDLVDDLFMPVLYVFALLAMCLLPALVAMWIETGDILTVLLFASTPHYVERTLPSAAAGLFVFGSFYFPMGLLAVAVHRDLRAASPHVVVPAMFRAPLAYWLVAVAFMLINSAHTAVFMRTFDIHGQMWFAFLVGIEVARLYLWFVLARMLGMTHWVYRERFRWLERT